MIRRTACVSRRIGKSADCVASQPPVSAITTIDSVTSPSAARNRASSASRASVLFPTWTSVPSASCTDAVSSVAGSQPSELLSTTASTPRSTTRTNSRSGAALLLDAHGVGQHVDAAAQVRGRVVAELPLDDLAVALRQRDGRQVVREEDDRDATRPRTASRTRARDEGRTSVPEQAVASPAPVSALPCYPAPSS